MKDPERQAEVDKLIGKVTAEKFNKFVNLGKQITDFVEVCPLSISPITFGFTFAFFF